MKFDTLHEKSWVKSLAAVTAFLVSVLGLYGGLSNYFHHTPAVVAAGGKSATAPVAQAGLTVAGQRTLDDALKQQIAQELNNKDANVLIACVRGDDEARKYAKEILSYLQEQGYAGAGLSFTSFPPSFHGVDIEKYGLRAFIKVGHQ